MELNFEQFNEFLRINDAKNFSFKHFMHFFFIFMHLYVNPKNSQKLFLLECSQKDISQNVSYNVFIMFREEKRKKKSQFVLALQIKKLHRF